MTMRDATAADYPAIAALHAAQGIECPLPQPGSGATLAATVVEDGGRIVAALFAVRCAEIVMVLDHAWRTPRLRWTVVEALHGGMERKLRRLKVDSGYCWLAPQFARGFARKLRDRLGWQEPLWKCLQRKVGDE